MFCVPAEEEDRLDFVLQIWRFPLFYSQLLSSSNLLVDEEAHPYTVVDSNQVQVIFLT